MLLDNGSAVVLETNVNKILLGTFDNTLRKYDQTRDSWGEFSSRTQMDRK